MTTLSLGGKVAAILLLLSPLFPGAAARAQSGDLLIADFEAGKLETTSGLAWLVIGDEQLGGTSDARLAISRPGAKGSGAAMRISFNLSEGFPFLFAGAWALLGTEGLPADLSAYRGLRFYARGPGGTFSAGVRQASAQGANYMAPIEVKPEWTLVEVPFSKLQRSPPGGPPPAPAFVPKDIIMVGVSTGSRVPGKFQLEIDQVELYQ